LLALRLLAVEGDYGTLVLTEESAEVLGRRREVMMRREPERTRSRSSSGAKKKAVAELGLQAARRDPDVRRRPAVAGRAVERGRPRLRCDEDGRPGRAG
jgi:ATP-dependent DNA helicase RecQ